jgi:hypothetical protein
VKAWYRDDVTTLCANVDAGTKACSIFGGLSRMTEKDMSAVTPGFDAWSIGERSECFFQLAQRFESAILPVHVENNNPRGCTCNDADVRVRTIFPPSTNLCGVGAGVLETVWCARMLARTSTIAFATGTSAVRFD